MRKQNRGGWLIAIFFLMKKYLFVFICLFSFNVICESKIKFDSEDEKECLITAMLGEISNGTEYEQRTFLWFFDKQTRQHGMGYCSEFFAYKPGGARKYSSSSTRNLIRIAKEKNNKKIYKKAYKLIGHFISGKFKPDKIQTKIMTFTNVFATRKWGTLSWHKKHLIDKIIVGKKVYSKHKWS